MGFNVIILLAKAFKRIRNIDLSADVSKDYEFGEILIILTLWWRMNLYNKDMSPIA